MSKATKRKHVVKEVLTEFALPEENQQIVKVVASRGNNLHEIVDSDGDKYLVSMPTRFRKNVWIKRGDFIVVEPISEGDKVKAEIISILYQDQKKYIQQEGRWPSAFGDHSKTTSGSIIPDDMLPPSDDSDNEDMSGVVVNANRPVYVESDEESEDDSDESKDDGSYLNSEEQKGEHETNSDVKPCDLHTAHNGS